MVYYSKEFLNRLARLSATFALLFISFSASPQTVYDEERKLIQLINELRADPQGFRIAVVNPYLERKGIDTVNNRYAVSLIADLRKQPVTTALARDTYLTRKARIFAKDMGASGAVGHASKKLGGLSTRLKRYQSRYIGENCSYGYSSAIDILMQLLIDEDVPSVGHRKNILNGKFKRIGFAIELHKRYAWNCVMDFSD
jgi:uncharacterized protein YkwD